MKRRTWKRTAAWLTLMALMAGCAPTAAVVAGGGSAVVLGERRPARTVTDDAWSAWKLRYRFARSDEVNVGNINVRVYDGTLLLTGAAASQAEIDAALVIAKGMPEFKAVHSELVVEHQSAEEIITAAALTAMVKTRLLLDKYVSGLNIQVETVKGSVFLTGVAKDVAERDRAIKVASASGGPIQIKEVVSYIEIRPLSEEEKKALETDPPKETETPSPPS